MTGDAFLRQLESKLHTLPPAERKDILYDYQEHIRIASENGSSEADAVAALGAPQAIAKELLADYGVRRAERDQSFRSVLRAVLASISLSFFNIVFILGPVIGAYAVCIVLSVVGIVLCVIPLILAAGLVIDILSASTYGWLEIIFALCLSEGIGLLIFVSGVVLTRLCSRALLSYLRYNLRVIKGENAL